MADDIDIKEERAAKAEDDFDEKIGEKIDEVAKLFPESQRKHIETMLSVDPSFLHRGMIDCDAGNLERALLHLYGHLDMQRQVSALAKKVAPKEGRSDFIEKVEGAISDLAVTVAGQTANMFMSKCIVKMPGVTYGKQPQK